MGQNDVVVVVVVVIVGIIVVVVVIVDVVVGSFVSVRSTLNINQIEITRGTRNEICR